MTFADKRVRIGIVLLFVIAGLLPTMCAASSTGTLTYRQVLDLTVSKLNDAITKEGQGAGRSQRDLSALRHSIPASAKAGETTVDTSWIKAEIGNILGHSRSQIKPSLAMLRAKVVAYRDIPMSHIPRTSTDLRKSRNKLNDVLARREYQHTKEMDWFQSLMRRFFAMLDRILNPPSHETLNITGWIVISIVAILFALLLGYLILRIISYYSGPKHEGVTTEHRVHLKKHPNLDSFLKTAEKHAEQRNYREALRNIYMASIMLLDRSKMVRYAEDRTNWEYYRALRSQATPEQLQVFGDINLLFDELIYGQREVTDKDYDRSLNAYRTLEESI